MRIVRYRSTDDPEPRTGELKGDLIFDRVASTSLPLEAATLLAPIEPTALRDFMLFEDHARAGASRRGEELNPAWFQIPISYKGNHRTILGPSDDLEYPSWTEWLDFELEIACVIGRDVFQVSPEEAADSIAGYTIMNDWSARDVQRQEMAMRLGPARSKDFATTLGPWLVTPDEFDPQQPHATEVKVDGETWFQGDTAAISRSFAEVISWVSQTEPVYANDVYGSGTQFGGCGLDQDRRLPKTCTVELLVDGLGSLRTLVI